MTTSNPVRSGRPVQVFLIAAIFLLPFAGAAWLYFGGSGLVPGGRSNHGALLDPVVSLSDRLADAGVLASVRGRWAMVLVVPGDCSGSDCRDALYRLRQTRRMLGQDMRRVERVLLHGYGGPDTLFPETGHPGLIAAHEPALSRLLHDLRPAGLATGGIWLIDPLGNAVMYFPDDVLPGNLVDDVEHLLELSRIG